MTVARMQGRGMFDFRKICRTISGLAVPFRVSASREMSGVSPHSLACLFTAVTAVDVKRAHPRLTRSTR